MQPEQNHFDPLPNAEPMQPHHPPMQPPITPAAAPVSLQPQPIVKMLSTRGVEYAMMSIVLWISAVTAAWILLNLVNGSSGYNGLVVPLSALIAGLPVFAVLFTRLRVAELKDPSLRQEPSKRRWTQLNQIVAFVVLLVNLAVFIYSILQHFGSGTAPSIGKSALNLLIVLVVAGGIFGFYWRDEHRA